MSTFDGSIELNLVLCRQYPVTGAGPWPISYWDCTNQNATVIPTVPNTASALVTSAHVRQAYATGHVNLYVMNDLTDWNAFFVDTISNADGETFESNSGYVYSGVFVTSGVQADAVTAHELGHALDAVWDQVSNNTGPSTFGTALANDSTAIDGVACATAFSGTVLAAGCSGKDPFQSNMDYLYTQFTILQGGVPGEWFATIFEHQQTGSEPGGLEDVLAKFTNMNAYMNTAINTSSHP